MLKKTISPSEIDISKYLRAAENGDSMNSVARKFNVNYDSLSKYLKEFHPSAWNMFRINGANKQKMQGYRNGTRKVADVEDIHIR